MLAKRLSLDNNRASLHFRLVAAVCTAVICRVGGIGQSVREDECLGRECVRVFEGAKESKIGTRIRKKRIRVYANKQVYTSNAKIVIFLQNSKNAAR